MKINWYLLKLGVFQFDPLAFHIVNYHVVSKTKSAEHEHTEHDQDIKITHIMQLYEDHKTLG